MHGQAASCLVGSASEQDMQTPIRMVWREMNARPALQPSLMTWTVTSASHQLQLLYFLVKPGTLIGEPSSALKKSSSVLHTWHLLPFFW
jgi:hypothetical protein